MVAAAKPKLRVREQEEPVEGGSEEAPPVESSEVPVPAPEIEPASAEPAGDEGGAE